MRSVAPGRLILPIACALSAAACAPAKPLPPVEHVDLPRFMGDWYVIANIPTWIERDAHNAVENYQLNADGTIATTFSFRRGSFDGERKQYRPTGFVLDKESNAVWGMQFVWPFKADYRIAWLDEDYSVTVIARKQRDYVWLMARQPRLPEPVYEKLLAAIADMGYDPDRVEKVPQKW